MLVPTDSLVQSVPPRMPAFFNPRARLNRDLAVIASAAHVANFGGPHTLLDCLAGLGARGLRIACEVPSVSRVTINDANPQAIAMAQESARMNGLDNIETSEDEACRFLAGFARRNHRGGIVDIDPFGSPAEFIDCGIRATAHGGMLAVTATDLQVLNGLAQDACKRRYGGTTIKTTYSDELALRLIIGCIRGVAGRLDAGIQPLFVHADQHYYRVYVRILNCRDTTSNLGHIFHCSCGARGVATSCMKTCPRCGSDVILAGPMWIKDLFEREFVEDMRDMADSHTVSTRCRTILEKCVKECGMPPTYYTLDEVASSIKRSPPKLCHALQKLEGAGFRASPTSFNPTGFRTSARVADIEEAMR